MNKNIKITESFAAFVANFDINMITSKALQIAKECIKDTIGVMIASTNENSVKILKNYCATMGGNPQAHIMGEKNKTSIINAAMVNAAMAHAKDFDDCGSFGHAGAIFVPTLLALGEWLALSGKELIAGLIVGFEIGSRLGSFLGDKHLQKSWHSTATIGGIAATATAGYLLKLDSETMQQAFGIAAAQSALGLKANFGTDTKSLSPANVVINALNATWLAKNGFTANPDIFDASRGYFSIFGDDDSDYVAMIKDLGNHPLQIEESKYWIKEWPCCYSLNPAIRLVQSIKMKNKIDVRQITSIEYRAEHVDGFLNVPLIKNALEAKFSLQFILASAFLEDDITEASFEKDKLTDNELIRLMKNVILKKPHANDKTGFHLQIQLDTGEIYQTHVNDIYHTLAGNQIENKFQKNATQVLTKTLADEISNMLEHFEKLKNIELLMSRLT